MSDTFDYDQAAIDALELLTYFGATVQLVRMGEPGPYVSGQPDTITEELHATMGVVLDIEQKDLARTLVQIGDSKAYLAPQGLPTPTTADQLLAIGKRWQIIAVDPFGPIGIPVFYTVYLRGQVPDMEPA